MTNPAIPDLNQTLFQGMQFLAQALAQANEMEMRRQAMDQESAQRERSYKLQLEHLDLEKKNHDLRAQIEERRQKEREAKAGGGLVNLQALLTGKDFANAQKLIEDQRAQVQADALLYADFSGRVDARGQPLVKPEHLRRGVPRGELLRELHEIEPRLEKLNLPPKDLWLMMQMTPEAAATQRKELEGLRGALNIQLNYIAEKEASDPLLRQMVNLKDVAERRVSGLPEPAPAPTSTAGGEPANGVLAPTGTVPVGGPIVDEQATLAPLVASITDVLGKNGRDFEVATDRLVTGFLGQYRAVPVTDRSKRRSLLASFQKTLRAKTSDTVKYNEIMSRLNRAAGSQ